MKKSDLKTGMIVTLRNEQEYMVFLDAQSTYTKNNGAIDLLVNGQKHIWNRLDYYNDDLIYDEDALDDADNYDIVKVEIPCHPYALMNINYEPHNRKLLWVRPEPVREFTMAELEKHFGCKVKIVKGNE